MKTILRKILIHILTYRMFKIPSKSRTVKFAYGWGNNFSLDKKWEKKFNPFNPTDVFTYISGHGWRSPRPKTGDQLALKMESGNVGLFKILEIKTYHDPTDMFFVKKAVFNGYQ